MAELVLCAECNRHVRSDACPFCGARVLAAPASVIGRASRAALFALAASACKETPATNVVDAAAAPTAIAPSASTSASVETTASAASSASAAPSVTASATASARPKPVTTAPAIRPAITAYGGPPTQKPEL